MKAKLKDTGEILEVIPRGYMRVSCGAFSAGDGRILPATALEFKGDIDWEQVRIQAAMSAMNGLCANVNSFDSECEVIAKWSVQQADALIDELKKHREL